MTRPLIDNGPIRGGRPPLPGQIAGDVNDRTRRTLLATLPAEDRRHVQVLEDDLVAAWVDDGGATSVDEVSISVWTAQRAAASLDPRFGSWLWEVWVDGDRQVAPLDQDLRWVERIPDAWDWNRRLTDAEVLAINVAKVRRQLEPKVGQILEWIVEHPRAATAILAAYVLVVVIVDQLTR